MNRRNISEIELQIMWNRLLSVVEEQAPRWKMAPTAPKALPESVEWARRSSAST